LDVSLPVRADIPVGYRAGFFVCGLPTGVTAIFSPNPAPSTSDFTVATNAASHSTLDLSVPRALAAGAYPLTVFAYFEGPDGAQVAAPPGGGAIEPRAATLTVDASGNATLQATSSQPAAGFESCSPIPDGFAPQPTSTPAPNSVRVYAWVSDPHPASGESETVTGAIQVGGQPVPGVLIHTRWYQYYGIDRCDAVTGSNGEGTCSIIIERTLPSYTVRIDLTFEYNGQEYTTFTSFTE
jgi:hypothetical protein